MRERSGMSLGRARVPAQRVGRNYDQEVDSAPDFWLIECDTFWEHVPPAIACTILAGPAPMLGPGDQWLVRVDPPVFDGAIMTDRVLVDSHTPDLEEGNDWSILCTGAYSLAPSVTEDRRLFTKDDWVGGHKITVTTRPEMHGGPSVGECHLGGFLSQLSPV